MSVAEFLDCLARSRLLSSRQMAAVRTDLKTAGPKADPEAISRRLVTQGLLTSWQARMLLTKQTGFTLGRYRLLDAIGKGGMGKVFKARDTEANTIVAIKVMAKKFAKNPKLVARFQREFEAASQLDSPHVVASVDAGQIGQVHFLVMEFVDGEGLDELADQIGRLPTAQACALIRQAALGLQHAHEHGMVHRDIKPANVIVGWKEDTAVAKLLDMGLVRLETDDDDNGMTRPGQVMGTPDYMSPEQAWNTRDVDIRADIYSLGCSLFRLLSGTVPFPGDNPLQVLMARCSTDAPDVNTIVPGIDPEVNGIVARMMSRDPAMRFQTPQEVADALQPYAGELTRDTLRRGEGAVENERTHPGAAAATQPEPSFREFLREMDSGAEVSLLHGFDEPTGYAAPSGSSIIKHTAAPRPTRKKSTPWLTIVAGAVAAALLVTLFVVLQSDGTTDNKPPPPLLAEIDNPIVEAGQSVRVNLAPADAARREGLTWALGQSAPQAARIDSETGEFVWAVPRTHAPGRVAAAIVVSRDGEVVERGTLNVDVRAAPLMARLVSAPERTVEPGQAWSHQLTLTGPDATRAEVLFRLAGTPPEGVRLNESSGTLTWTPGDSDVGQHEIQVELVDPRDDHIVDQATYRLLVKSMRRRPQFVRLPSQTVEAGRELVVDLTIDEGIDVPPDLRYEFGPNPPPGATIDAESGRFIWRPSAETRGRVRVQVLLSANNRQVAMAAFPIEVVAPTSTTPSVTETESKIPDSAEITAAQEQIREVYRRDFAQARSTTTRRQLAHKLFLRSLESDGAMQYALLMFSLDLANQSNSYLIGLDCCDHLTRAFGTDSVEQAAVTVDSFRTRGVSPGDRVQIIEAMWREALVGAEQHRFADVGKFLNVIRLTARVDRANDVVDQVDSAEDLLESLVGEDGADPPDELTAAQQLARDELISLFREQQFHAVFRDVNRVSFLRNNRNPLPDLGRSLWTLQNGGVEIEQPASDLVTGFVDSERSLSSFTLRMTIAADNTTGLLMIGAPTSGDFRGYQLPLGGAELLHVKPSTGGRSLAVPQRNPPRDFYGWHFVEVTVQGTRIGVSINGVKVVEAAVPTAPDGLVGLIAYLRGSGSHRLRVRDVRVRELR